MKIELQEPFKSKYRNGYLTINSQNRRIVTLVNSEADMRGMSYARYLYSVYLGSEVPSHLEVDHIDDDKTNDDFSNLQLLTQEQNRIKENYNYIMNKQIVYGVYCSCCGSPFLITQRQLNMKLAQNTTNVFCNRSCSAVFNFYKNGLKSTGIPQESIATIKRLRRENRSVYEISRITGFSRNTVMKYW